MPKIRDAGLKAVQLDEKFDHAGPLRLLGSVYVKAPPWPASIGDVEEGEKYLERAVKLDGDYPLNHLLFADALASDNRASDATREYNVVLAAQPQPEWAKDLAIWQRDAKKGLQHVNRHHDTEAMR